MRSAILFTAAVTLGGLTRSAVAEDVSTSFAKLVVEGLERAGQDLTRDKFLDAMESIRNWDSGGILPAVSFSETDHHAQKAGFPCELDNGRFKPLTDWLTP